MKPRTLAHQVLLTRRLLLALSLLPFVDAFGAEIERVPRPMRIHHVEALNLEIWTERDPTWEIGLSALQGQSVFSAETPALTYPPAGMTWMSDPSIKFSAADLEGGARGAIHQAARNYGARDVEGLALRRAQYGELSGYEAQFAGLAHGTRVDVLVFVGHRPSRPAVVAHAYTLEGKLDHIREHIRRSWTHLRYLK